MSKNIKKLNTSACHQTHSDKAKSIALSNQRERSLWSNTYRHTNMFLVFYTVCDFTILVDRYDRYDDGDPENTRPTLYYIILYYIILYYILYYILPLKTIISPITIPRNFIS